MIGVGQGAVRVRRALGTARGRAGLVALAGLVLAAGCGAEAPDTPAARARAPRLSPVDPRLAELYDASCRACHARPGAGAPLTGDKAAWAPRRAKGVAQLLTNVIQGVNGMPAGGQCAACGEAEFTALIAFLTGEGPAREAPAGRDQQGPAS